MDLAKDESENGTSPPTEKDTGTTPPASTDKVPSTIPPPPTEKQGGTTPPAPAGKDAGTTPEKSTNPREKGTPKPDRPATPSSESCISDDDISEQNKYGSCLLESVILDPGCKKMLHNETEMFGAAREQNGE